MAMLAFGARATGRKLVEIAAAAPHEPLRSSSRHRRMETAMNAYDHYPSPDYRPYDHLPSEERRTVIRWRAATSAFAVTTLLAVCGFIAVLQPRDAPISVAGPESAPSASTQAAATGTTAHPGMLARQPAAAATPAS
jgi:hypothetical protein